MSTFFAYLNGILVPKVGPQIVVKKKVITFFATSRLNLAKLCILLGVAILDRNNGDLAPFLGHPFPPGHFQYDLALIANDIFLGFVLSFKIEHFNRDFGES